MKKGLIVLPLLALGMALPATDEVASYFAGSTVYVVYDADEGKFSDGLNMKSFSVRKGISWARLNARERPSEDPTPNDDQMNFGSWYYNGAEIASDFIIDRNIRVTANYVAGESSHNFQTDSWPVLAKVIDDSKTQDNPIKYIRANYDQTHQDDPASLVGQTRSIKFGGTMYEVRVIGEGEDFTDEAHNNAVGLTFEFVNTIDAAGYYLPYSLENSNNYANSYLADVLNNEVFNDFDKTARRYMKSVYKPTNVGDGTSTDSSAGDIENVLSNVFVLSLKELNADKYNEQAATEHQAEYTYDFPYDIEEEALSGDAYSYYKSATLPSLKKTYLGGTSPSAYWTRSPEVESSYFTWHINENGEIGDPDYEQGGYMEQIPMEIGNSISVCPCFCY